MKFSFPPAKSLKMIKIIITSHKEHLSKSIECHLQTHSHSITCWIPMTSLTQSRLEIMFSLTSGHSSFNCERKSGKRCSIVL